jgi:dTDP-4-amino-4,6-dideoxyglucose
MDVDLSPRLAADRLPALFGGERFRVGMPVGTAQLSAPPRDAFFSEIRELRTGDRHETKRIHAELERRLAALHVAQHAVLVNNASVGLLVALRLLAGARTGAIAMPSFSYRGLPYLARMLGRAFTFVDVLPECGTIDPLDLKKIISRRPVSVVLAVHNVDRPCKVRELEEVCGEAGVPLLFDSVYSIFNEVGGRRVGGFGDAEVFTLHATKLINGFEGGYLTTQREEVARGFREMLSAEGSGVGIPAELDPIHAASALACLSELDAVVARNRVRHEVYERELTREDRLRLWPASIGPRNYSSALVEVPPEAGLSRDLLVKLLCAEGFLARPYYGPALHQTKPWNSYPSENELNVTHWLAGRILQLPVGDPISEVECVQIVALVRNFLDQAARLRVLAQSGGRNT